MPPTWLGLTLTPAIFIIRDCVDSSEVLKFSSLSHPLSKEAGEKAMSTLKGSRSFTWRNKQSINQALAFTWSLLVL